MVARRPVVAISGQQTELPPGDSIVGGSLGTLTAGSGLDGGGNLSSTTETNVSLAPNPSGLIFVDNKYLATDGVAQRTAETALASGNYALAAGTAALASGIAGSSLAATALASGNAALADIAAIQGGTIETYTAASAVASGYAVGLDDGGSVQSVWEVVDADTRIFGSAVVFESANTRDTSATYDSTNNRVVIAYRDVDNSNYGTAIVGTVSGTSISFGTPATFSGSNSGDYSSCAFDSTNNRIIISYRDGNNSFYGTARVNTVSGTSIFIGTAVVFESASTVFTSTTYDSFNDRVVIAYQDAGNSDYGTAIVGTVSGTSISFGTAVVFESSGSSSLPISSVYDSTNNRVVIAYRDVTNSGYGTAIVGTVSGTSISFGTAVVFESAESHYNSTTYDSTNNRVVIAYRDGLSFDYGTAIVGTVSGTSISFGTAVVFESAATTYISTTYDSTNNRVVIAYSDAGNSDYGTAIVGTVSGTSISFGTAVVFESATSNYISTTYDSTNNRVVIVYADGGNSDYGTAIVGTVSGSSISFGTAVVFESASFDNTSATYDSTNDGVVIAYRDGGNSNYGTAIVAAPDSSVFPTISSQNNFIGIAQTTAASGSAVQVRLPGSYDQNNTGLTPGAVYYVNPTTSGFTTTATQPSAWSGAVNWGPIGRAVNSTTLLLTDMI